jgi:anti-sigma B factor antagonist
VPLVTDALETLPDDAEMVFVMQGEIDLSTARGIGDAAELALRSGYVSLVLDLTDVTFMDSQGIRALVLADRTMTDAGGRLALRRPAPPVRRVLDLTGMDTIITIEG